MELKISKNLEEAKEKNNAYFHKPGKDDLDTKVRHSLNRLSKEQVAEFIESHVSYERIDPASCISAGRMIVSLERFIEMVDSGYNIYLAKLCGKVNDRYMIDIEFQLEKEKQVGKGR